MGTYFFHRPRGQSIADTLRSELEWSSEYGSSEVLAVSAKLTTAYLAIRRTIPDGSSYVYGMVCHIHHRMSDYYNFGYKPVSEDMGPYQTECPKKILELLSPLEDIFQPDENGDRGMSYQWAKTWREACQARLEKPKPKKGDMIKFAHPIRFTDGSEYDKFIFLGRNRVSVNGWSYRISNLSSRDFEVVRGY